MTQLQSQSQKINDVAQNFFSEMERLKKKCNLQVDKIIELEREKKELEQQLNDISKVNEMQLNDEQNKNSDFIRKWMYLVKKLYDEGLLIGYKNITKNAKMYVRAKRNSVEDIISSFFDSCEHEKEFYDFITKMQFCRCESGKFKFYDRIEGKNVQVYMIRRDVVELSIGRKIEGEKLQDD